MCKFSLCFSRYLLLLFSICAFSIGLAEAQVIELISNCNECAVKNGFSKYSVSGLILLSSGYSKIVTLNQVNVFSDRSVSFTYIDKSISMNREWNINYLYKGGPNPQCY